MPNVKLTKEEKELVSMRVQTEVDYSESSYTRVMEEIETEEKKLRQQLRDNQIRREVVKRLRGFRSDIISKHSRKP